MTRRIALLLTLTCALGCTAPTCDVPLSASVTIEETGERLAVTGVWRARSFGNERRSVIVELARGQKLSIDVEEHPPLDRPLGFVPDGDPLPPVRVELIQNHDGGISELCNSERDHAEGALVVRRYAYDADGFPSCLDATLRIRFVDCTETVAGAPAGDTTYVVELPAR